MVDPRSLPNSWHSHSEAATFVSRPALPSWRKEAAVGEKGLGRSPPCTGYWRESGQKAVLRGCVKNQVGSCFWPLGFWKWTHSTAMSTCLGTSRLPWGWGPHSFLHKTVLRHECIFLFGNSGPCYKAQDTPSHGSENRLLQQPFCGGPESRMSRTPWTLGGST